MYDPIKLITNLSLKLDHAIGLFGRKDENFLNIKTDKLLTKEECMEILSCNERTLRYYIYEKSLFTQPGLGERTWLKNQN